MQCPKCSKSNSIREGFIRGHQRYYCKDCCYHYRVAQRRGMISRELKALALKMDLEGLGFRRIGRRVGVSNGSVLNWVKAYGQKAPPLKPSTAPVTTAQLDELSTSVGSKKSSLVVDGY